MLHLQSVRGVTVEQPNILFLSPRQVPCVHQHTWVGADDGASGSEINKGKRSVGINVIENCCTKEQWASGKRIQYNLQA